MGFVFGANSTGLWIASSNATLYNVGITDCAAVHSGTISENCTSGTLMENHLYCVSNDAGTVYNITTGGIVGFITPPPDTNFGYDLFTHCPGGATPPSLVVFYENTNGLIFYDMLGLVNITFPFGSPTKKWIVSSMNWC
jgi:hypothetical protein